MNLKERDKRVYFLGKEYLLGLGYAQIDKSFIESYLESPKRKVTINEVFQSTLLSSQEAQHKKNVIENAIGEINNLKLILDSFDPVTVVSKYYKNRLNRIEENWKELFEDMSNIFRVPAETISNSIKGTIPQYCKTILSVSHFLSQFNNVNDFYSWVENWNTFTDIDNRNQEALPLLISSKLHGFGFPLACNMLKDLGFISFAKPDTHIHDICKGLELCNSDANDIEVFKAIVRIAQNVNTTPYAVDKLFWLIGSGKFHNHPNIGINGKVNSKKKDFIQKVKNDSNYRMLMMG